MPDSLPWQAGIGSFEFLYCLERPGIALAMKLTRIGIVYTSKLIVQVYKA